MEKEFIPYTLALDMKSIGFDEPCFGWFTDTHLRIGFVESKHVQGENEILAPLYQQAFRWFREKYNLHSYVEGSYPWFRFYINSEDNRYEGHKHSLYEEAELECLKKLIEIVKNKQ